MSLKDCKNNVALLPDVNSPDIYNYLVNTPSEYIHKSMKVYKSLKTYEFFVSGHVHDVAYHKIDKNNNVCQRQGQKQEMYECWVAINKFLGWILTGNCTCMAGYFNFIKSLLLIGVFRIHAKSKMEFFVAIVNGWKPLTSNRKSSIFFRYCGGATYASA